MSPSPAPVARAWHADRPIAYTPPMARGSEAVWGVEVGDSVIRAVRVARRAEGGFRLLAHRERRVEQGDPDALVAFLRKQGLLRHPLVIAVHDPGADLKTVFLPPELAGRDAQDLRMGLLEYVHPEPEQVDLRFRREDEDRVLLLVMDRARVEGYLVALERAAVPCYALVSDLEALHAAVRRSGLFEGDGVIVRILPGATDLLFLDGDTVGHLGLPAGADDLRTEEGAVTFASDVLRLIEYRRSRFPREGPERIVLLGIDEEARRRLEPHLRVPVLPFPSDAASLHGRGGVALSEALEIARRAPAALGAALAAAASPRRLDLAFRALPDELPAPPAPAGTWIAAALLLWAALAVAWVGTAREVERLRGILAQREAPRAPAVAAETAARLRELVRRGRLALAFPAAVERVFRAVPGPDLAPYRTASLELSGGEDGSWSAEIRLLLPGGDAPSREARERRFRAWRSRLPAGASVESESRDGERSVRCLLPPEDRR